jgi:hypothetical protein
MTTRISKRIERAEAATREGRQSKDSTGCICFPANEPPFFLYQPVHVIAVAVKCPIHGDRFPQLQPLPFLHIGDLHKELQIFRWVTVIEQYRTAWNTSFPSGSWPVEEIEIAGRTWLLPRSETGELLDWRTAQTAPPWKRAHTVTLAEERGGKVEDAF